MRAAIAERIAASKAAPQVKKWSCQKQLLSCVVEEMLQDTGGQQISTKSPFMRIAGSCVLQLITAPTGAHIPCSRI